MTSTFTRTPRTLRIMRRNRAANPRCVDTTGYTFQTSTGGGTLTAITDSGNPSPVTSRMLQLQLVDAVSSWGILWGVASPVPLDGTLTWTFSAYVRTSTPESIAVNLQWTAAGAFHSLTAGAVTASVAGTWYRLSVTGTAPAGADGVRVQVAVSTAGASGNTLAVTGLLLESGSTLGDWFDGAKTDAPPLYYRWAGVANNSTSTENILEPNDITAPFSVDGYDARREARSVAHEIAGTSEVDVTVIPAGPREGEFKLAYDSVTEAMRAVALFGEGGLFTFSDTDVPQVEMVFVPTSGQVGCSQSSTRKQWIVAVPFVEVVL